MEPYIKETLDYKGKQIKKFTDAKEKSMALFAAGRDATMIVSEIMRWETNEEHKNDLWLKEQVKMWRTWFYYEIYSTDPDEEAKEEAKKKMNPTEFLGF